MSFRNPKQKKVTLYSNGAGLTRAQANMIQIEEIGGTRTVRETPPWRGTKKHARNAGRYEDI